MTNPIGNQQETVKELLDLNHRLLASIATSDWETYAELCDPSITAFEPEARGQLVEGMAFHGFYFDQVGAATPHNTTVCAPHVRLLDNVAVVCYVRLVQSLDGAGKPVTSRSEETRVWHCKDGVWRHVHFHRSVTG
jgi:calcium/calmodulin-dependent protein kinase (CaM kinase) II